MADGYGYGYGYGYGSFSGVPNPVLLSSPSPQPPASAPPFLASHPAESYSYDPTQGRFDPMVSHGSYHRSPAGWSNNPSYPENFRSQTPSSSFYADNSRPGVCSPRGEDSYKDMISHSGFYSPMEPSSDENFSERQRFNCNSATSAPVSSLAEMLIRNPQEPFFKPIATSGLYSSSNALDDKYPGHYLPGYDKPQNMNLFPGPPVEPYMRLTDANPSLSMSSLKTQALFDRSLAEIHLGEERAFPSNSGLCNYAPENPLGVQSSLHGSSIEPVNFDVLLGYGEATGQVKPLSEDPDLRYRIVGSQGSKSPQSSHPLPINIKSSSSLFKDELDAPHGDSSLYQRLDTLVADSENCISENSLKNAMENFNCDEHRSWNHFMVSSEGPSAPTMFSLGSESRGAIKADSGNAQSAVNYKTLFEGSADQPSEDVQANQKSCKLQEEMFDIMNRDKKTTLLKNLGLKGSSRSNADGVSIGQSPERHLCDQGDFPSPTSSPRVSSVVNAMHNLSEVLVYECFNNGSWLKLEQLENLDKVVDNLTKCLKKITGNKTIAGETSLPTQAVHVSCPNVVNLHEASKGIAKDFQGLNVNPLDCFGFKERVAKNEMTQSIKNILASNFPDGEENHPQTLLYKNLWLETEAALCSTTCMARYHRIKNEIGNLKLQDKEISADASTLMQEPSPNPQKSVPIVNNAEQETAESLRKCGKNVVTMSHDAPQSSRFNSDPVDAVLSLMCRSFTGGLEEKPDAATTSRRIHQETVAASIEDEHNDVIDRFQILKLQETKRKLKSQNCPDSDIDRFQNLRQQETNCKLKSETKVGDEEETPEASEMANIGRSSHMSDVMDRFQILKRREAEQMQASCNSLSIENEQPRIKTQMHGDFREFNSQVETCIDTEAAASGKGYESPTSDWEHVLKDD